MTMQQYPIKTSRKSPNRLLAWGIIAMVLTLMLNLSACQAGLQSTKEPPTPTPLPTHPALAKPTYQVQRGEVIEMLRFNGRVAAVNQESLFFRTSGRVNKIYFEEGDTVETGQVIADLEGIDELVRQKRLNELNQRRAEIGLEMAQLRLELFKKNTPTWTLGYNEELAMQMREVELAQISLEEVGLYGQSLDATLNDARIIAPIDGKLISLSLLEGREVQGYKEVGVIADLDQLEVSASLDDAQMGKLVEGMEVVIKTISGKEKVFSGAIRRLPYPYGTGSAEGNLASSEETRVAFDPSADMSNLKLGDLLAIEVVLQRHADTLWLPPQAVRVFEGRHFVVVQEDTVQRRVDVKVGLQGDDRLEILEGLTEGQTVLRP